MRLSRFSIALGLVCALFAATQARASTMYKCVTNGQVTYANEPCKGQTMQVVKGNDTNMVQVNTPKVPIGTEGSASDLPVVKLQPKIDTSVGEAANLGLGAAAPANKNTDGGRADMGHPFTNEPDSIGQADNLVHKRWVPFCAP